MTEEWFTENLRADQDLSLSALVHVESFAGEGFIIPLTSTDIFRPGSDNTVWGSWFCDMARKAWTGIT